MTAKACDRSPQEKVCGYEYTVRRGDSFYLIANRLGVPLRDLLEANSDINPARLMVGDVLCIPMEEDDGPAAPAPEGTSSQGTSPQGTSPQGTSSQGTSFQGTSPAAPPVIIVTPVPTPEEDDLDAPAAMPDASGDGSASGCPQEERYTVAAGETAADIQLRADVNLHTLQQANPALDLTTLQPGQTVCVPAENIPCDVPATYTLLKDETLESAALKLNASLGSLLRANPCMAPSDFRAGACIWVPEM